MKLKLYKNKDSENTINKNLVFVSEYDVRLRNDFDSTYPTIKLKVSNVGSKDFNYLELVELDKKYLVKKTTYLANGILEIQGEIDTLETYKNIILSKKCKHKREIKVGDYGSSNLEKESDVEIENFKSEFEIVEEKNIVMSSVGA